MYNKNKAKGLLVLLGVIIFIYCCSYYSHHYTRGNCEIFKIENNKAYIIDTCNYVWEYDLKDNDQLQVGDLVDLKMYDNCTDSNVKDDIVKKIIKISK